MPKLGGLSNIWSTVRELNVSDIRDSAEQQLQLAVVGSPELRADVIRALYTGPTRYPSPQRANIAEYDVPLPRD